MTVKAIELFYLLFQGVLLFQALIFSVLYFIVRKKEILFYSLFLFAAAVYFFINAPYTFFSIPEDKVWSSAWYGYTNIPVIIIENFFYLLFLITFFKDMANSSRVIKLLRTYLFSIPLLFLLFIAGRILQLNEQYIFYSVKLLAVLPAIAVAYMLQKQRLPFANLVASGLLCTVIGTCITVWMIILYNRGSNFSIFTTTYPLFFIRVGLLGDMIFYMAAILRKWHYQEKQLAIEKLQSQLAVEKLRNKISGELHDDIGSTLSGIAMYGYMSGQMLQKGNYASVKDSIEIMQRSANEAVHKLGDLVWAINPGKDSFISIVEKVKQYGLEMCNAKNIQFECSCTNIDAANRLPMDTRQQLYLFIKETVNNAVKYSAASIIRFRSSVADGILEITVDDNGKGFDVDRANNGNGLNNMKERAKNINAAMELVSSAGEGTHIKLQVKITP